MIFNHRQLEKIEKLTQSYAYVVFNKVDKIIYYSDNCSKNKTLLDCRNLYNLIFSESAFENNLKDKSKIIEIIKELGNIKAPVEGAIIDIFTSYNLLGQKNILIEETANFLQKYHYYKKLFDAIMKKIPIDILGYKYRREFQKTLFDPLNNFSENIDYFDFVKQRLEVLLAPLNSKKEKSILKTEIMNIFDVLENKSVKYFNEDSKEEFEEIVNLLNKKLFTDKKVNIILSCVNNSSSLNLKIEDNILAEAKRYYQSIKNRIKYTCIFYSNEKQIINEYKKVSECPEFKEELIINIKKQEISLNF